MSGNVVEVHYFPKNPDKFAIWGSEINLYQIKTSDENENHSTSNIHLSLSKNVTGTLLASETRYQYIRCLAPSCHSTGELQLAVGLANGKVALCNFVPSTENNVEYTPRQSRPCLCLAWNELEPQLLAMGHDRNRSDHCITVWDTSLGAPTKESSILHLVGLSETAHSLCWDKQYRILIAGMSHKYLKMLDLRQSNPVVTSTNTRAVHGLSIAPNGRYLGSYIDNIVTLWDIRNIDKPISQLQMQKNITSLSWCPTRSSVFATLQRDSPFVHLVDIHWPGVETDKEPQFTKRNAAPFQSKTPKHISIGDISWHPTDLERILALSGSGAICDFKIHQRIAIAMNNTNGLWGATGDSLTQLSTSSPPSSPMTDSTNSWESSSEDIAELIHRRALNDYGQVGDLQRNGDLAEDSNLRSVWRLLAHMSREDKMIGLKNILEISSANEGTPMTRSDSYLTNWNDEFPSIGIIKVYKSEWRDLAQHLCGWTFVKSKETTFSNFIKDLCTKREFTRAALIACFQLKVRQAIEILGNGAELSDDPSAYRMAAIALSGFNLDKSGLWRTQCSIAQSQLSDSHLRAMFAFLAPDNDNYETVLNETGVSLSDRMAFACVFLSDLKLAEYVKAMIAHCIENGDLNGLLLTGATNEGINLLQSHLDQKHDVQTVSLIAARFLGHDLLSDQRVQCWITSYRYLLDSWGLWENRAQVDITLGHIRSPQRATRSVYLLCSFCGKSVSACLQEDSRIRPNVSNVNKLSSCPNCRKPLPRCSLCLLHMGTTTGAASKNQAGLGSGGWQSRPFSKWFSWCQTCRHGGHTEHLAQWFNQHSECPVTSCSCKCYSMDLPMPNFPREIS